jgi:hypothetical protein
LAWLDAILAQQRQHDQRLAKSGHGGAEPLIVVGHAPVFSAGLPPHGHGECNGKGKQKEERVNSAANVKMASFCFLSHIYHFIFCFPSSFSYARRIPSAHGAIA